MPERSDILLTVILIVIVIVLFIIAMTVLASGQGTRGGNVLSCPPNQCATDLKSGIKRCPQEGQSMSYNPGIEVCNSATLCDNPLTPFAQRSDKSTDSSGICPLINDGYTARGSVCPCLRKAQCADYVTATFNTRNGDPYTTLQGQRIAFFQTVGTNPLTLGNAVTDFCQVPIAWLNRAIPGCSNINEVNASTFSSCLQSSNHCLTGTLAIIPQQGISLLRSPVACVRGTSCQIGLLPVWDDQLGAIVCQPPPSE